MCVYTCISIAVPLVGFHEVDGSIGSDDGSVKLWHLRRPSCIGGAKLGGTSAVECVQFNAHDTAFAAGLTSGSIQLFSLKSWNKLARLSGHR